MALLRVQNFLGELNFGGGTIAGFTVFNQIIYLLKKIIFMFYIM